MATVKQLLEQGKAMNPRLARRILGMKQASKDRKILKPEKVVAKPTLVVKNAIVPVKSLQAMHPDVRRERPILTVVNREDPK